LSKKYSLTRFSLFCFCCRKRKPRPNHTKGWFLKEPSTSSPQAEDGGPSSPPRIQKQAVMQKLMLKKKKTGE
jgi:hypothetical protein